ncbi:MAG: phosphatase PAP2 family protein [Oscillospiraceae bacterium]|nr:phosphatase PAP2 family protein [Oscillospiraceae bacterium]
MGLLYLLERIRIPVLNEFMLAITYFGDEIAFLVTALILFWCVDKRHGYYILAVGFIGTLANQFMKLWFRIPRPWVKDPNFTILEQAREAASGYSFPSGHSQSAVGTFGGIAYITKNKVVRIIAIIIAVLVPISRMYVGVHTPMDVLVASLMALVLIVVLRPVIFESEGKYIPYLLGIMTVLAVAYLCFVEFYPFPSDVDAHNLASGIKNAYTLLGSLLGLLLVYTVEKRWIRFPVKAVWWAQVLKIVIGLGLVLAVKSGLKDPLNALFGESVGRAARYFLIVVVAGMVWPLSFRWFSKLGTKE